MCLWEFGAGNLKETGRFYQERWIWGNSVSGDIGKVKNLRNLSHVPPKHLSFTHCEGARLHCHEWGAELIMYFLQRAHNQIILSKLSVGVKVNVNGVVSGCDPVMDRWTVQGLPPLGLADFQSTCCGQVDLIQGWSYLYSDEVTVLLLWIHTWTGLWSVEPPLSIWLAVFRRKPVINDAAEQPINRCQRLKAALIPALIPTVVHNRCSTFISLALIVSLFAPRLLTLIKKPVPSLT